MTDAADGVLDPAHLDELAELDDGRILRGLVDRFPTTVAMADDVAAAIAAGDAAALTHRLVGRALNSGARVVEAPGRADEAHLEAGGLDAASAGLPALRDALEQAHRALRDYVARLG